MAVVLQKGLHRQHVALFHEYFYYPITLRVFDITIAIRIDNIAQRVIAK